MSRHQFYNFHLAGGMIIFMSKGTLSYNNGQIYYETIGSGEVIVFVHGFTLDNTMWHAQVKFFSKDYRVITYDARGFGKSSVPERPYDHAADLHALLEHLKIEQAHVVGLSMGGRIAVNFALTHPNAVRSLTLIDAALDGYESEVDWNVQAKEQGLEKAKENWLKHELFTTTQKQPEVIAALRSTIEKYSGWHWLHHDLQSRANTHARDRLREITKPALVIVGEDDLTYFHNIANVLATGISGAQKAIVPKTGHMVNMEAPDELNNLLADFITKSTIS
jgi:pimeloyl-ACP methyl ester carboxylesterase